LLTDLLTGGVRGRRSTLALRVRLPAVAARPGLTTTRTGPRASSRVNSSLSCVSSCGSFLSKTRLGSGRGYRGMRTPTDVQSAEDREPDVVVPFLFFALLRTGVPPGSVPSWPPAGTLRGDSHRTSAYSTGSGRAPYEHFTGAARPGVNTPCIKDPGQSVIPDPATRTSASRGTNEVIGGGEASRMRAISPPGGSRLGTAAQQDARPLLAAATVSETTARRWP